ncbi:MAG: TPR repeat protein [Paracoccaceae bacterium]|jgi:TPR repeat protein
MRPALAALLLGALTAAAPAPAADGPVTTSDELGETNPEEMSMNALLDRASRGEVSLVICSAGYPATKSGRHANSRVLFDACVKAGYTQAMTWMSYLEDNGYGGAENPDAAAGYDRMAAEAGDPVGMFNYGLDLMRGRGVARDDAAGRRLVDEAADKGLAVAQRLQRAEYDLDEVTPDADNWKYQPLF